MNRFVLTISVLVAVSALTACGADTVRTEGREALSGATSYPLTVENCGTEVTFDRAPERILLTGSAQVPYLDDLGVVDRIISRAGVFPEGYFSDELQQQVESVPLLTDRVDASGHLKISSETIIDEEPDLLLGIPDGVDRAVLKSAGINAIDEPAMCNESSEKPNPSFEKIYERMRFYGEIFDRNDEAQAAVEALQADVAAALEGLPDLKGQTVAVLWPEAGAGTFYAYGRQSMSFVQTEALGLTNVYDDVDERVFESTLEALLGRDPDILVLLYDGRDPQVPLDAIKQIPGANDLAAVREGRIMTQLFNFSEPPTPLSIEGLHKIAEFVVQ